MSEQPDRRIMSNAGRCDICGRTIDMRDSEDTLVMSEYKIEDEDVKEGHGLTDQDAADAVADALEGVAETPEGRELARVIREEREIRVHGECLDHTNYSQLETEPP